MILPERKEVETETYSMLGARFPILDVWEFLKKHPREPMLIDVEKWKDTLSYLIIDGKKVYKNMSEVEATSYRFNAIGSGVNWKYARELSPEQAEIPGIVVTWKDEGKTIPLMIDGHHRLGHKLINDHESMKVYVLSPEEFKQIFPQAYERLATN